MCESKHKQSHDTRDPFARLVGGLGLLVAVFSVVVALLSYFETVKVNERTATLQAKSQLDSGLDMMAGEKGTESFFIPENPPNEAQRRTLELAGRNIEKALDHAPDFYLGHEYLGIYLHISGRPEEALEHHRTAIQLNDDDGWPYADYANSLRELGRYPEAIQALEKGSDLFLPRISVNNPDRLY
jgi:tetratricopeptide (TPR) repeat protein